MLKKIMKKVFIGTMVLALGMPPVSTQGAYVPKTDVADTILSKEDADGKTAEDSSIENQVLSIKNDVEAYQSSVDVQESAENVRTTGIVSGTCGEDVTYELNLDTGNVVIGGTGKMTDYKEYASPFYEYRDVIRTVTIEEGVTSVGANLFTLCSYLEVVTLPQSVTTIGEYAFLGCVSMEFVSVPETVTKIGTYALGYYLTTGKGGTYSKTSLVISGTTGSAANTYATRQKLTFIDPATLSYECGYDAFWSFDMDTGVLTISGKGDMKNYEDATQRPVFECYKSRITSVVIEEGINTIGAYTFEGYEKIKEVVLPEGLTSISSGAFRNCTNLEKITLPQSLTTIYPYAFFGCSNLEKITLPESLTTIGAWVFSDCTKLQQISIPKNVKKIENSAFVGCRSLKEFQVDAENANFSEENGVLLADNASFLYIFPEGYEEAVFEVPESVEGVATYCFTGSKHLKSLLIQKEAAFYSYDKHKLKDVRVYYDGEEEITEESLKKWTRWGADFINANEIPGLMGKDTLSIYSESKELSMGESMELFPEISPRLATEFIWTSSDENVAVVSDTGRLIAVNPGTTTIQVKTRDNQYVAEATFQVTGAAFTMEDYQHMELSEELLNYTSSSVVTKQIVSEKLHGIYFLNGKELSFYSFVSGNHQVIETFEGCDSAYVADDMLYILYENVCYTYDLLRRSMKNVFHIEDYNATAIGADWQGRIYIAAGKSGNTYLRKIFLYSSDGEKLSELAVGPVIYEFSGFDSTNGCFYMESYFNFRIFGYSYPGRALTMGQVTGNDLEYIDTNYQFSDGALSYQLECILFLFQDVYMRHQTGAELLGNKYLVATSAYHGLVDIMNSNSAGANGIAALLRLERVVEEEELENDYVDTESIGTRAVYNKQNDSVILYENNKTLSEYLPTAQKKIATFQTKHNVFNLLEMDEHIIAIEKEGDKFYLEIINWENPKEVILQSQSMEMPVGTLQKITPVYESLTTKFLKWSSSNEEVATVSQNGIVSAWKEGTTVITASLGEAVIASVTITVTPSQTITPEENTLYIEGAETDNESRNHYNVWSDVITSYLVEKTDGILEQIEDLGENGVQIKTYTKDLQLESYEVIPKELEIFGGFYSGENANFLVFGQENPTESDNVEVVRIVKYSKDWERLDAVSVKGANTTIPFDAGSLRMTEVGGKLYIHTSHEMYTTEDGENHQANMTFVLDEETLEIEQSHYEIDNIRTGYVSHSLNQFVETDGEYVYRVDHGDVAPRAIALTQAKAEGAITDVKVMNTFTMQSSNKHHYNYTGVSIGGFELSRDNCLIVGNSVDQTSTTTFDNAKQWNIFLTVTGKNWLVSRNIWLTDYPETYDKEVRTPHLVKLNEEQFLVMWEEVNNQNLGERAVKMLTINSEGEVCSEIKEVAGMKLSDCKPVLTSDGLVTWYVTDGEKTTYYKINPYQLSAVKDDTYAARKELCAVIEEGAAKEAEKYTDDSWAIFEAAYHEAVSLLERNDLTIKEIMTAKEKLNNAMSALVRINTPDAGEAAREELYAIMAIAYSKIKEDYTAESWKAFEAVYNEAKNFFAINKTVEEIIAMKDRLEAAINALVPVTPSEDGDDNQGGNEGGSGDNGDNSGSEGENADSYAEIQEAKRKLYNIINDGMYKVPEDYTQESWAVYEAAYNEAMRLFESSEVTVKELNVAGEELEQALNALVPVTPPGDGDDNQDGNEGSGNEGNGSEGSGSEEGDSGSAGDDADSYEEILVAKTKLYEIINNCAGKLVGDSTAYTPESWAAYITASIEAIDLRNAAFGKVTVKQLIEAGEKLENALNALVLRVPQGSNGGETEKEETQGNKPQENKPQENKPQENKPQENKPQKNNSKENVVLKPGKTFKSGNYKFKIKNNKEVIFTGVSKKTSKVKIPNTVTYKGKVLKVTSIGAKALRNNKVVTQITVGTNVTVIGKSAFEKCKKLQKIIIRSTKLKKVQKKAFSGIKANARIQVPKKCRAKYRKLLKNKGQGKKVTIS